MAGAGAGAGAGGSAGMVSPEIRSWETDTGLVTASYNAHHKHPYNWLPVVIFGGKRPN